MTQTIKRNGQTFKVSKWVATQVDEDGNTIRHIMTTSAYGLRLLAQAEAAA
jgi:hypothetical protein